MKIKIIGIITRNMKVKKKLSFLSLLLIFIMISIGLIGFININKLGFANLNIIKTAVANIINCHKLKEKMEEIHMSIVLHIGFMNIVDKDNTEKEIKSLNNEALKSIDELKSYHENFIKPGIKESKKGILEINEINEETTDQVKTIQKNSNELLIGHYNELKDYWNKYNANIELILELSRNNDTENAFYFYTDNGRLIFNSAMGVLESILKEYDKEITLSTATSEKTMKLSGINLLILIVLGAFLSIVISIIIGSSITDPIKKIISVMSEMSKGDLTKKLVITSKDEFGNLSFYLNTVIDFLLKIITELEHVTLNAKGLSFTLKESSENVSGAFKNIKLSINEIRNNFNILNNEIKESNNSIKNINDFSIKVADQINSQTANIAESSTAIEQMTSSIHSVTKTIEAKLEIVNNLNGIAASGQKEMLETIDIIKKITESTNLIMNILQVINNLSRQTNLLSMNAAIEAAHAGDSGRGFSVVADEIRLLAEDTGKNSKVISKSLKEIVEYIHISEKSSIKSGENFKSIVSGINGVAESMHEIKNSMQEMSTGTGQILSALTNIINSSQAVSGSSADMKEKINSVMNALVKINEMSDNTFAGINSINNNTENIYETFNNISSSQSQNANNIEIIDKIIKNFTV